MNHQTETELLDKIKTVFQAQGIPWAEPYLTTEGAINRKEAGCHPGLYWIYPEVNFYFGKAATNTVHNRHKSHRAKLDVDLAAMYSTPQEKKQPKWIFPAGWKAAVRKFIIEDTGDIPDHWVKTDRGTVIPGVLDFPVKHRVAVDTLPVWVWNLEHLYPDQIAKLETAIIQEIQSYANSETHRKRTESE